MDTIQSVLEGNSTDRNKGKSDCCNTLAILPSSLEDNKRDDAAFLRSFPFNVVLQFPCPYKRCDRVPSKISYIFVHFEMNCPIISGAKIIFLPLLFSLTFRKKRYIIWQEEKLTFYPCDRSSKVSLASPSSLMHFTIQQLVKATLIASW